VNPAAFVLAVLTTVTFPVTTADAGAQSDFDRGLFFYYAYDGADAARAFDAAAARDPKLAIAYWGEALADGPDLNTAMSQERFLRAKTAAEKAVDLEKYASSPQRAYINAIALRYKGSWADWKDDDATYRSAMKRLAEDRGGGADDVATVLAAEAFLESGGFVWAGAAPVAADSREALVLVKSVLARDPANIMANHLCIHLYDGASNREAALACARQLDAAELPPQAEHLAHMPAHYWIEAGNYVAAAASSERAYQLFMRLEQIRDRDADHDRYLVHDVYVGYSAAMMLEDYANARVWSARMDAAYGTPFDALTAFRFGHFADAYALARDATPSELAVRGLAAIELGRDADARAIAVRVRKLTTGGDLVQLFLGRMAELDGDFTQASIWIDRAVKTQRDTFADELIPLVPALEARGAFAMRRAAYSDAAAAYRATLAAYPNDPRAVAGLAAAIKAEAKTP
jgi:hypothetical protein